MNTDNNYMDLNGAIKTIDFSNKSIPTDKEYFAAHETFFKEMFNVKFKNNDGTYKSLYNIFTEASRNWRTK